MKELFALAAVCVALVVANAQSPLSRFGGWKSQCVNGSCGTASAEVLIRATPLPQPMPSAHQPEPTAVAVVSLPPSYAVPARGLRAVLSSTRGFVRNEVVGRLRGLSRCR